MNKRATILLFVVLTLSSLLTVNLALAAIPKPSVPEFTVKLVAHPYDVPPTTTTTIDQYTGKEIVTTTPGYHVENKSIEVTIKNQPFTPYTDADGNEVNIYYNVRFKGHFTTVWTELYPETQHRDVFGYDSTGPVQSSSGYTITSCPADFPDGAKVDFQVEAREGYHTQCYPFMAILFFTWVFTGEYSGWSETQTLTIGETPTPSPATTPTQTPSPVITPTPTSTSYNELQQTEQEMIIGVAIAAAVIIAGLGLLIYLIKRK
ncbi:hypothetical protein JXA31_06495 [Candidatus Bathyarchaeota archaeon]|nr:hypothetical protein [Candidatus Bathyarchaeota archaeon]